MKKLMITTLIAGALMGNIAMAASTPANNLQFGVVNYVTVFQQVPQGNATLQQLKTDLAPKVAALKKQQTQLEQQVATLDRNSPTMTKDAVTAQEKTLSQQQQAFQQQVTALEKTEAQKERQAANNFNTALSNAIQQVATQNHLSVVFNSQATPYVASGYDVTSQVVTAMQAAAKTSTATSK